MRPSRAGERPPPEESSREPDRARGRSGAGARRLAGALAVFVVLGAALLASAPGRNHYLLDDDHGFQLCLGLQTLLGKTPGVDVYNAYGPLVVLASAAARALSGSLLGESLLCTGAWAAALLLVYVLVAARTSAWTGLLAAACAFALQARFYKWYLWLVPLSVLAALAHALEVAPGGRRRAGAVLGAVLGVGWLLRPDVGSLSAVLALVGLAAHRRLRGALGPLVAAGLAPPLAWLAWLGLHDGPAAPGRFLGSTFVGGWMASSGMGTPLPAFDPARPLGVESVRVLAYGLLAAAYAGWAGAGLLRAVRGRDDERSRFLAAAGLVGLGVLHQALHRKDGQHLLQVLAPALAGAFVHATWTARELARAVRARRLRAGPVARALLLAGAVPVGLGLARWGRVDLVEPEWWPAGRYASLADPLRDAAENPWLAPVVVLRRVTEPDEPILVFPLWPQGYVFADRRMSGMLHGYYPGVYDRPPWSTRNLEAIERDPPAAVLVSADFLQDPGGRRGSRHARYRLAHADVDAWIRARYGRIAYRDRRVAVLLPGGPGSGPPGGATEEGRSG